MSSKAVSFPPSRFVFVCLGFSFALLLAGCNKGESRSLASRKGPAATPVVVAQVKQQTVPLELRAIGNVEAFSVVEVKSQVAGPISKVLFEEGQEVRQGQVLFQLDSRPFEQAVRQAEAEVAARKAALALAEANYERDQAQAKTAKTQAGRYAELAQQGIVAREQNEQSQTLALAAAKAVIAAQANIASARAAIQGAESQLEDAKLQLSYTTIRAPISGRAGGLSSKAGNLVGANSETPLVTINQITPVYAAFSIPEQSLPELRRFSSAGKLTVQAQPQGGLPEDVATGVLDFVDNRVDSASGTILLKAKFANQDRRLWPGQFVNVTVRLTTPMETVVPTAAVKTAQRGNYVFVVKSDSTAEQRTVQAARAFQDLTVIESGLELGEQVIVEGQLRVKPGAKVRVTGSAREQKAEL